MYATHRRLSISSDLDLSGLTGGSEGRTFIDVSNEQPAEEARPWELKTHNLDGEGDWPDWRPWDSLRPFAPLTERERIFINNLTQPAAEPQRTLPGCTTQYVKFDCGHQGGFVPGAPRSGEIVYCRGCSRYRKITHEKTPDPGVDSGDREE